MKSLAASNRTIGFSLTLLAVWVSSLVACQDQISTCEETASCVDLGGEGGDGKGGSDGDQEQTTGRSSGDGDGDDVSMEECKAGTWDHDEDPRTACKKWSVCEPGSHEEEAGSPLGDRVCTPCADGTFSDEENADGCRDWTVCPTGVASAGSSTRDAECSSPAIDVALGLGFSCALREDGTVACWGKNDVGQLGGGHTDYGYGRFPAPVMVEGREGLEELTDVMQISAGQAFACAVRDDASVWCWGNNSAGELGTGTYAEGDFSPFAVEVEGVPAVDQIDAGAVHVCAVLQDRTARCWGGWGGSYALGGGGQSVGRIVTVRSELDDGSSMSGIVALSSGANQTCAILDDRRGGHCWGASEYGEVVDTFGAAVTPVQTGEFEDFVAVSAGKRVTCFLHETGHVTCHGRGPFGGETWSEHWHPVALPVPEEEGELAPRVVEVSVDESARCLLFEDGTVRCWGDNYAGQLGDGSTDHSSGLVEVKGLENIVAMDASYGHVCAVDETGRVSCWGENDSGQLGDASVFGSTQPMAVPDVEDVVGLASGGDHTCALHESGKVTCWGKNDEGQLGLGSDVSMSGPEPLSGLSEVLHLSAKDGLTFATKRDNTVRYFGTGLRAKAEMASTAAPLLSSRGVENVSRWTDVLSVAVGANHACAVKENGKLSCWGDNQVSQCGPDWNEALAVLQPTELMEFSSVDAASAGLEHSCALINGDVLCWAGRGLGEAGNTSTSFPAMLAGKVAEDVAQIATGYGHNLALTDEGAVLAWGHNYRGQLGYSVVGFPNSAEALLVDDLEKATWVAAGELHSCAVLETGQAACWGDNVVGQLGRGELSDYDVDAELVLNLSDVEKMSAGTSHTCALHENGTVSCWGTNEFYQLGQTRAQTRAVPGEVSWGPPRD